MEKLSVLRRYDYRSRRFVRKLSMFSKAKDLEIAALFYNKKMI
jgi:hypothetical protein